MSNKDNKFLFQIVLILSAIVALLTTSACKPTDKQDSQPTAAPNTSISGEGVPAPEPVDLPADDSVVFGGSVKTLDVPFHTGFAKISIEHGPDGVWKVRTHSLKDVRLQLKWRSLEKAILHLGKDKKGHKQRCQEYYSEGLEFPKIAEYNQTIFQERVGSVELENANELAEQYLRTNPAVVQALMQEGWQSQEDFQIAPFQLSRFRLNDNADLPGLDAANLFGINEEKLAAFEGLLNGSLKSLSVGMYCLVQLGVIEIETEGLDPVCCTAPQPARILLEPR